MRFFFSKYQWSKIPGRSRGNLWSYRSIILGALWSSIVACGGNPSVVSDHQVIRLLDEFERASTGPVAGDTNITTRSADPFVKHERGLLFVPFGAWVDFPLEIHTGSTLLTRDTKIRGSAVGRLAVTWTPDGGSEKVVSSDLSVTEHRSVSLGVRSTQTGRLRLTASTREPSQHPGGGVLLFDPEIRAAHLSENGRRSAPPSDPDSRLPNIIVYLADALRADHLGCYGYERGTSPNIDRFASGAVLFSNAQAQSSWTRPAVASLFTGLWPQQHHTISKEAVLPAQAVTLAETLRDRGYQTAAVVGNGNVANIYGFSQGFSYFRYLENVQPGQAVARSAEINQAVVDWLDEYGGRQPFFLFIHTVDPHVPYAPPEPYLSEFVSETADLDLGLAENVNALAADKQKVTDEIVNTLVDLYDGEIAANDASFGRVLAELNDRDIYDSSAVVFLSDHGEEFFDRQGWTHGNTLNGEVLDIPLIIKLPHGEKASRVDHVVDHVDLFSTLLDLVDLDSPSGAMGQSLLPMCRGVENSAWPERAIAHLDLKERFSVSLLEGRWKLILRRRGKRERVPELYDRFSDRREMTDLAGQDPARVEAMRERLQEAENRAQDILEISPVDAVADDEMRDQLRALGYVEDR